MTVARRINVINASHGVPIKCGCYHLLYSYNPNHPAGELLLPSIGFY